MMGRDVAKERIISLLAGGVVVAIVWMIMAWF